MLYNLTNMLDKERFKRRSNELFKRGAVVEMTEKNKRTSSQNAYLHLLLGYLALETGNTLEYVKREYFKITCNPDIFLTRKHDPLLNTWTQTMRSSAALTTAEMTTAIDRLRNWSAQHGIYLPEAGETEFLTEIAVEVDRQKQWLGG